MSDNAANVFRHTDFDQTTVIQLIKAVVYAWSSQSFGQAVYPLFMTLIQFLNECVQLTLTTVKDQ